VDADQPKNRMPTMPTAFLATTRISRQARSAADGAASFPRDGPRDDGPRDGRSASAPPASPPARLCFPTILALLEAALVAYAARS
jgi:hypothetical protein